MTQYGHPNYPDRGGLLEIIGSHSHIFSVMFQTVCLWSCLNFDDNICVSNESQLLSASENAAQHVSEVGTWGGCCAGSSRGTVRTFCSECAGQRAARWILGPGLGGVFRIHLWGGDVMGRSPLLCFTDPVSIKDSFFFLSVSLNNSMNIKERSHIHSFQLSEHLLCLHHCARIWGDKVRWRWSFSL